MAKKTFYRALGLFLLSVIFYPVLLNTQFQNWGEMKNRQFSIGLRDFFLSGFWNVLIQICFSILFLLPIISQNTFRRVIFMFLTLPLPLIIYVVIYKYTTFMLADNPAGFGGCLAWMGGWSFIILLGSLIYDIFEWDDRVTVGYRLFQILPGLSETVPLHVQQFRFMNYLAWPLMIIVYFCSCLCAFLAFDICVDPDKSQGLQDIHRYPVPCEGFVWYQNPPFFPPNNPVTIWTMQTSFPSISSILFNSGFTLFLYSIAFWIWDVKLWRRLSLFRTFGTNSLLTYIVTLIVSTAWNLPHEIVPYDSPSVYVIFVGFPIHLFLIWVVISFAEKNNIFIAL